MQGEREARNTRTGLALAILPLLRQVEKTEEEVDKLKGLLRESSNDNKPSEYSNRDKDGKVKYGDNWLILSTRFFVQGVEIPSYPGYIFSHGPKVEEGRIVPTVLPESGFVGNVQSYAYKETG